MLAGSTIVALHASYCRTCTVVQVPYRDLVPPRAAQFKRSRRVRAIVKRQVAKRYRHTLSPLHPDIKRVGSLCSGKGRVVLAQPKDGCRRTNQAPGNMNAHPSDARLLVVRRHKHAVTGAALGVKGGCLERHGHPGGLPRTHQRQRRQRERRAHLLAVVWPREQGAVVTTAMSRGRQYFRLSAFVQLCGPGAGILGGGWGRGRAARHLWQAANVLPPSKMSARCVHATAFTRPNGCKSCLNPCANPERDVWPRALARWPRAHGGCLPSTSSTPRWAAQSGACT